MGIVLGILEIDRLEITVFEEKLWSLYKLNATHRGIFCSMYE